MSKGSYYIAHMRTVKAQASLRSLARAFAFRKCSMSHVMRKPVYGRSACASTQSDQHLCWLLHRKYNTSSFYIRNFKLLPSFCGCAGRLESYLSETRKTGFLVTWLIFDTSESFRQRAISLEEQSDHGLTIFHSICIFSMHFTTVKLLCSNFKMITAIFFWDPNFYGYIHVTDMSHHQRCWIMRSPTRRCMAKEEERKEKNFKKSSGILRHGSEICRGSKFCHVFKF